MKKTMINGLKSLKMQILKTKNLFILNCLLFIVFFYLKWGINSTDYKTILLSLITVSGIFSALVISFLISGLNTLMKRRFKLKDKITKLSDKLTNLRRLLYYVIHSSDFWGNTTEYQYLMKIRNIYPNINAFHKDSDSPEVIKIKEDERFESNKTNLFINLLTIVDIKGGAEELYFIQSANKYKYSLKKLSYYHDSFNQIWYFIQHKSAVGLNDSGESLNILYRKDFIETYKKITGKTIDYKEFNSSLLVELGNQFYNEISPDLYQSVKEITSDLPKTHQKLINNLIMILVFGVFFPLLMLATKASFAQKVTMICLGSTILIFINLVFDIYEYTYDDTKIY